MVKITKFDCFPTTWFWDVKNMYGKTYQVSYSFRKKDWTCECEDWLFRVLHKKKDFCKHIKVCMDFLNKVVNEREQLEKKHLLPEKEKSIIK